MHPGTERNSEELLTTERLCAEYTGGELNPRTIVNNRSKGTGAFANLPYLKIGRRVFYRRRDVDAYLQASTIGAAK